MMEHKTNQQDLQFYEREHSDSLNFNSATFHGKVNIYQNVKAPRLRMSYTKVIKKSKCGLCRPLSTLESHDICADRPSLYIIL